MAGSKLYFTGKPCRAGHFSERYVSNGMCFSCKNVNTQNFKLRNPSKFSKYSRAYVLKNKTDVAARRKAYLRLQMAKDPQFRRKESLKVYGLSFEEFEGMKSSQDNKCPGCHRSFEDQTPHVDHDHVTGKVRGLLCGPCNRALGLLRDKLEVCLNLADYLRSTSSTVD